MAETAQARAGCRNAAGSFPSAAPLSNAESERPASSRQRAHTGPVAKRPRGEPHLRQAASELGGVIVVSALFMH